MSMSEPSLSGSDKLRSRFARLRERARRLFPFISGALAMLLALFLYNFLVPGAKPLTQSEVNAAISSAMASATPRPAFSDQVYQIIQPSLVLIQTQSVKQTGGTESSLGS